MCHAINKPTTIELKRKVAAPPIKTVMKNLVIGIDVIEEPKDEAALKKRTIEFINDYLFNPSRDKSYCEDISFEKFDMMPSLKGFITTEQANSVAIWVTENFSPKKDKDGKYIIGE